jgi:hypothetical protein
MPPINRGTAFRNGKVYIFDSPGPTRKRGRITVVRLWPNPAAWRKLEGGPWKHFRPKNDLPIFGRTLDQSAVLHLQTGGGPAVGDPLPRWAVIQRECWEKASEPVPPPIQERVIRFHHRRFHVLSLLARVPGAMELDNDLLLFLLASSWVFKKAPVQRPLRSARAIIRHRRREQLAWLDWPGEEWAVAVTTRVRTDAIRIRSALFLRSLLKRAQEDARLRKLLLHTATFNRVNLRIATDQRLVPLATPALLSEVGELPDDEWYRIFRLFDDTRRLGELVGRPPISCRSLEELRNRHDRFLGLLPGARRNDFRLPENQVWEGIDELEFPPPPFPGVPGVIEHLDTGKALREWGETQRNCLATRAEDATGGGHFYYRILSPEPASLCIGPGVEKARWRILELRGTANGDVSPQTFRLVAEWLYGTQSSSEDEWEGSTLVHEPALLDEIPF